MSPKRTIKQVEDKTEELEAKIKQLEADLAKGKEATSVKAVAEANDKAEWLPVAGAPWYMCPTCKGLGQSPSDVPRKIMKGVKYLRHNICPTCDGWGMIQGQQIPPESKDLKPVMQCGKCRNWYAVGGGKPVNEPCYQDHHKGSHCHWHDLSMSKPHS